MTPSILRTPWQPGPDGDRTVGRVLVSVTEFTSVTQWRALGVAVNGMRLRRSWPGTGGAVGMWLWVDPAHRRSGSVSVWSTEQALTDFVRRPDHVGTVRAFRAHGTMRATSWTDARFDAGTAWRTARALLTGATPWPAPTPRTGPAPRTEPTPRTGKAPR
ncbi:hypothetical protein [Streptomyces sp. KL116D]|uniref:hypothetical protein n=1 Tax=Streptomyces sp. KL116D TaxID=3045152 RepID=UPI003555CA50